MAEVDVDSLVSKIMSGLKRRRVPDDDGDGFDDDGARGAGHGANARIRQLVREKKALVEEITAFEGQISELAAAYAGNLDDFRSQTAEQIKSIGLGHAEDLALVDHGITDQLGRQTVRAAWDRAPKDSRGKSPTAWWDSQVAAHKAHVADPDTVEAPTIARALTPYLPTVEPPKPPADEGRRQFTPPQTLPSKPNGAGSPEFPPLDAGMDGLMGHLANTAQG